MIERYAQVSASGCQRSCNYPLRTLKSHPTHVVTYSVATGTTDSFKSPGFRFSFSRKESPLMLIVTLWCNTRSRIAVAIIASPKSRPTGRNCGCW
jgi:hypothetical protein